MATSSFDKDFIVKDPKAIDLLIEALENPVEIVLPKRDLVQEEKRKQEILCKLRQRMALKGL